MSTRKLKGFRFFKETISKLNSVAKDYGKDEATIVEAALSHFLDSKKEDQKNILKKFLIKSIDKQV